jgi:hypothetical protein
MSTKTLSRRDFVRYSASAALALGALPAATRRAGWAASNDYDFIPALEAARLIREKKVSSAELTERMLQRIESFESIRSSFVSRMKHAPARRRPTPRSPGARSGGRSTACP